MTFTEAIQTCLQKYATFDGRARRSEYWYWTLASGLVSGLINVLFTKANGNLTLFGYLLSLAIFIPGLSAAIRRMHDIGRSGWAVLISLIPLVGGIIVLVWLCTDSKPGDNAYGPNPKENPAAAFEFVSSNRNDFSAESNGYTAKDSSGECPFCGAPVKPGSGFCEYCGAKISKL